MNRIPRKNIALYFSDWKNRSQWISNSFHDFNKKNINLLFNNSIPCILIRNFIDQGQCKTLLNCAQTHGLDYYQGTYPRVGRIGATQYEHSFKPKFGYFVEAYNEKQKRDKLIAACNFDPINMVINQFNVNKFKVNVAHEEGYCDYYVGLFRVFEPGAKAYIHFDYAPYDGKDWAIGKLTQQISFNIYLTVPEKGGELVIYNKQWQQNKYDKYRLPESEASYGFTNKLVEDTEFFKYKPQVGDLLFFNSQNFHEVKEGNDYRFSVSSFFGREEDKNDLMIWN